MSKFFIKPDSLGTINGEVNPLTSYNRSQIFQRKHQLLKIERVVILLLVFKLFYAGSVIIARIFLEVYRIGPRVLDVNGDVLWS